MKSFSLPVIAALSTAATCAVAAQVDSNAVAVHSVFGVNDYGR